MDESRCQLTPAPCVQAAHLVHLPLLPVRDAGAGGGGGAHQGAAARHDLVHLQDPLLAHAAFHIFLSMYTVDYDGESRGWFTCDGNWVVIELWPPSHAHVLLFPLSLI